MPVDRTLFNRIESGLGSGATVSARKMTGPESATITYTLSSDSDHSTVLGDEVDDRLSGTGDGEPQVHPNFGVSQNTQAALVGFVDASGAPIKAGATVRLDGVNDEFIVGHDGEAFLRHLLAQNGATIEETDGATCRAEFGYEASRGTQVRIDRVMCRRT